ncbi:flagellar basal body protein [Caulobacter sp. KR2-114]|uniref:flagellar basal body protein n=1 Tax=Caulobacter sp. KR2-114 TaxID=3400912 RepID=UPI003C0DDEEE
MSQDSNPANARVEALIVLTDQLTSALAQQCKAFEAHRPQDAAASMEGVGRMANVYRRESAEVRLQPALVSSASPALRQQLVRSTEAFEAVLARHGRAVLASKTVTEGLVKAVAHEVAATRLTGTGYGPGAKASQAQGTAIALDRQA